MACKTSFEFHHNFPKLAEEAGFTFNTHKPRVHINWNKIKLIEIENLIRDRKFLMVEQHINDVLDCVLESEFDVKILDEGVMKMFRLAQLAVEYQQFCRHYLDRSVFVLKEEVTNLIQELDVTKKSLREKEDENRKLRRKSRHSFRTPLPYGNENIAAMILKTLNQNKGEFFASTSQIDTMQYNKCSYCEKVFLNQLYLKSHISRRHANVIEIPQRDTSDGAVPESLNTKLATEVDELKSKLKQMEDLITNTTDRTTNAPTVPQIDSAKNIRSDCTNDDRKEMKDAEVSANVEVSILDKIQEWKKEEREKYNEELTSLRKQIIEIINTKEKQDSASVQNEIKKMEQLHTTIKEQGCEIVALKQELLKSESCEKEKRKKLEEQMQFWVQRAEMQSNEYKSLLQKLNDVATEAQEFRNQAKAEKERAMQLEELLKQHQHKTSPKHVKNASIQNVRTDTEVSPLKSSLKTTKDVVHKPTADVITLKKLQQKAQELLVIDQSSTFDSSTVSEDNAKAENNKKKVEHNDVQREKTEYLENFRKDQNFIRPKMKKSARISKSDKLMNTKSAIRKQPTKIKAATSKKENGYVYVPGSPLKIVRAKITEQVNERLISLGVDPLKKRLAQNVFQKQRKLLQEQQEIKTKKCPSRQKIMHSIICHLDQSTTKSSPPSDYISPNKTRKTFNLSSVISNVKTKALSLVKSTETLNKQRNSYDDVAKKAMALLKTPPGSGHSSPILSHHSTPDKKAHGALMRKNTKLNSRKPVEIHEFNDSIEDTTTESDVQYNNQRLQISPKKSPRSQVNHSGDNVDNRLTYLKTKHDDGHKIEPTKVTAKAFLENKDNSSDDVDSILNTSPRKFLSEENLGISKGGTKGVLKNASSTSSLNKKKVLFDMDAIQMKSVSASPSQSITEKSDNDKKYEPGKVNLDNEDWDISSIENEPVRNISTKIQISSHTSPKIAELKETIESQLTRRNPTLSTALVGGVDTLGVPMQKSSYGGSNTSLGSSILDDTGSDPIVHHKTILKPRAAFAKDDSEIEISDLIAGR